MGYEEETWRGGWLGLAGWSQSRPGGVTVNTSHSALHRWQVTGQTWGTWGTWHMWACDTTSRHREDRPRSEQRCGVHTPASQCLVLRCSGDMGTMTLPETCNNVTMRQRVVKNKMIAIARTGPGQPLPWTCTANIYIARFSFVFSAC